ncbi:MAG: hypothetical protein ACREJX_14180, partial [Polyangiaceae bacterium]
MTRRFVLEQDRPEGWLADSYLALAICGPLLLLVVGIMLANHARPGHIAIVILAAGAILALANYLADIQFAVTLLLGEDGIVVYGNRQDRTFVSHAAIDVVEALGDGYVAIQRSDGSALLFRARSKLPVRSRDESACRIIEAIDETRAAFHASKKAHVDEPLLHRSGRRALEFVRDLTALTRAKVETYRSAPFDRDRLWRIAENPSAIAHDRIAAFIALRVDATADDMARLRESKNRA